jgi:hypothetical protein
LKNNFLSWSGNRITKKLGILTFPFNNIFRAEKHVG